MAKKKKVYIGVGHGGSDPGAVANGFKEKDLTLEISKACNDELKRHGVTTKISRTKDIDFPTSEKVKDCNAFKADFCIDIHINAGGGDGFECYYDHKGGKSKKLASAINKSVKKIGQNSRGLKIKLNSAGNDDYFGIIRDTDCPAVLVECAFIDNKTDIKIIDTKAEQKEFGIAIAKGILKMLGIKYIDPKKPQKLYCVQVGAYSLKNNAVKMQEKLEKSGYDAVITMKKAILKKLYCVQVGAYSLKSNATNMKKDLKDKGFNAIVVKK
jgi:N-acetylmuramoyl-L-alanine amidase